MKMAVNGTGLLRAGQRTICSLAVLAGISLGLVSALPALAAGGTQIIVISNDRGGLLGQRNSEIMALRQSGQAVELRGTCFSACTMYLSLPNACVDPAAIFGFHGPSRYGDALSPAAFEHWSQLMAGHYQEPLRSWYISKARYRINGYFRLSGADLIRMGYRQC